MFGRCTRGGQCERSDGEQAAQRADRGPREVVVGVLGRCTLRARWACRVRIRQQLERICCMAAVVELDGCGRQGPGLVLLGMLTNMETCPKDGLFMDCLRQFERRRELNEQASGKKFDDELAMAMLPRSAPAEIRSQLKLDLYQATSYASLRERSAGYKSPGDIGARWRPPTHWQGAAPMKIDGVKGKAKEAASRARIRRSLAESAAGEGIGRGSVLPLPPDKGPSQARVG